MITIIVAALIVTIVAAYLDDKGKKGWEGIAVTAFVILCVAIVAYLLYIAWLWR